MRFTVVGGAIVGSVVLHDDLTVRLCLTRRDIDAQRIAVRIQTVLDGVFHKGLQRQGRHAEIDMRRIVFDKEHILMLCLFHGEIRAGMLELIFKGYKLLVRERGEVLVQIGGEVQRDLLRLIRVLLARWTSPPICTRTSPRR